MTPRPVDANPDHEAVPLRIAIITGSTRPERRSATIAKWAFEIAQRRDDAMFEVVDIADFPLRDLDEPLPAMAGRYTHEHTRSWARRVAAFDAFVFVTPEYNHSLPGALKTAIDFLYAEWNDKAAGCIGYGIDGGVRAVEHLRQILAELKVATVRSAVALTFGDDFERYTEFTPRGDAVDAVAGMLDDLVEWATALRALRLGREATAA